MGNKFQGQSIKLCSTLKGSKKVWNLQKHPLTLHYGMIAAKDFNSKPTTDLKTTWDNEASSIGVTKFQYIRHEVPQKCVKTCGVAPHVFVGKVTCLESHFREKKKTVANKNCRAVGLRMPQVPKLGCPATAACVNYKTSKSTVACTKTCGFPGKTYYGKVWCQVRLRNGKDGILPELCFPGTKHCGLGRAVAKNVTNKKHVGNGKCMHWNLAKPPRPPKPCSKTSGCVEWHTTQPTAVCATNCGFKGAPKSGSSFCRFTKNRNRVNDRQCVKWKVGPGRAVGNKPAVPTKGCPSRKPCTKYVAESPAACWGVACGQPGFVTTGGVNCKYTASNTNAPDSLRQYWGQTRPAARQRGCAGGGRCCGRKGKCQGDCCSFVSTFFAPTNSCTNCPFGNQHVWPNACSTSRRCS